MTGSKYEEVWVATDTLIRDERKRDLLGAGAICAFADELGFTATLKLFVQILYAFIDLTEEGLILRRALVPKAHHAS
jgi:hypothetical protein